MLGTETITAISVDGANRKWLGTSGSGAYLLSADGTQLLKNYSSSNSPLFSDSITSIAINQLSGDVWFGTSEGTISIRETATSGKDSFNKVYSFPNPVREDFSGNVTITGLVRDTEVKITDISGNLVYETTSEGGQASWDLSTYNGRRVRSGVYLVFCAAGDGSESCITRILVISR
jgi:ligand-binding sensor domain-containing protein